MRCELAIAENDLTTLKDTVRELDAAEREAEGNELEEDLAPGRCRARIVAERDREGCARETAGLERGEERPGDDALPELIAATERSS
jgi:hypothetical protein